MRKTLFCGVDLHSNNAMYVSADGRDKQRLAKRLPNQLPVVLEHAQLKPAYERLQTMPGVGVILALTILLETGDIGRFATVGDYTSYCRCVRATHRSNGKKKADNNSRNGNAYLAWAFVEAVHHAIRVCPKAKSFYDKKRAKCNGTLATKALAAKWSKAAYYIMKRQEPFDLTRVFG